VMSLELPPLRERKGDIELLVDHFVGDDWHIEDDALQALIRYSWPGNVRQLINVVERAKILADNDVIRLGELPKEVLLGGNSMPIQTAATEPAGIEATDDLGAFQRQKVLEVLKRVEFNKARAARALGISRRKLYRLLEKYNLGDDSSTSPAEATS
jgi:DNA-binding NtrC family response regulator